MRPAKSCAKAQNTDNIVKRYWCDPGRNSRKMAESTGRFPPTPTLQRAANTPIAAKFGEPAAIRPKTDVIPMVKLKAHRRPKMSPVIGQRPCVSFITASYSQIPRILLPLASRCFVIRRARVALLH